MKIWGLTGKRKQKEPTRLDFIQTDMHSHLLPGIDDGVADMAQALDTIRHLHALGYDRLITTPHILNDYYPNTPEIILGKLKEVQDAVAEAQLPVTIEAAAEYFLDETFLDKLNSTEQILTFGKPKYLLFETGFMNEPILLNEGIFQMTIKGYQPVLAHPERYIYLSGKTKMLEEIVEKGVLLQVNILSFTGYYSEGVKKMSEKLLDMGLISFLGTDCHGPRHVDALHELGQLKSYKKIQQLKLLNNSL